MTDCRIVLSTFPSASDAEVVATRLVTDHLAACVSVVPGVRSHYLWEGKLEHSEEVMVVLKTTEARLAEMVEALRGLHPYSVPEILVLDVAAGLPGYLDWVRAMTSADLRT
jgi:periplasmic divalent cation tolerance protein